MQTNESALKDNHSSRQGVQVIERAALILRALQKNPTGLSLGEIAKDIGLPRSTVQRIVDALIKESFVIASSTGIGFRLGPALIPLGSVTHFPIIEIVNPMLKTAAEETGETVDLSVSNQEQMVFIDQIPTIHRLAATSAVGVSFPMHSAANGKAALALMTDDELMRYRNHVSFHKRTDNTITSWEQLTDQLDIIRKTGIAFDREENSPGISAVAIALRAPNNDIIAVSIPTPTARFEEKEADIVAAISKLADNLKGKLVSHT